MVLHFMCSIFWTRRRSLADVHGQKFSESADMSQVTWQSMRKYDVSIKKRRFLKQESPLFNSFPCALRRVF